MTDLAGGMTSLAVLALTAAAVLAWPARHDAPHPGWTVRKGGGGAGAVAGAGVTSAPATSADVADALALLALALRAGLSQDDALERVARCSTGAVHSSLRSVTAALRWGWSATEAWACAPPVWRAAALAWEVAETTGAPVAALVDAASQRIRDEEARRVEAAVARTGVLLVLPLGLAFLPAFACTSVVPVVLALTQTVLGP